MTVKVGSQSEDLEPSLKEAGTDVNWEVIGPIIAGNYFLFVLHIFNNHCHYRSRWPFGDSEM